MSDYEHAMGGLRGEAEPPEMLRQRQITYIQSLLLAHEETDCHGAYKVHVLYPADLRAQLFEQWRLVNFLDPEELFLGRDPQQWVNREQAAGWLIRDAAKIIRTSPHHYDWYHESRDVLLLSDVSYATAIGPSRWVEQKDMLLVPDKYLHPLTPDNEAVDLPFIASTLWRLLPADVRDDARWDS